MISHDLPVFKQTS